MRTRVAHILLLDALGGVENWYLDLAEDGFFSNDDHVIFCISKTPDKLLTFRFEKFSKVVYLPSETNRLISYVISNRKELKKYDCFYNHTYLRGFKVLILLKLVCKSKIINHVHSNALHAIKKRKHRVAAMLITKTYRKLIDNRVAVSNEAAIEFYGSLNDVTIIPCLLRKYERPPIISKKKESNILKLIHIGRFYHSNYFLNAKNQSFIIDILYQLERRNILYKMTFCGEGDRSFIEAKINFYGLKVESIEFIEWVDPFTILQEQDIFLFPSNHEGFGLALLEAQISNLVTIASENTPEKPFSGYSHHHVISNNKIDGWVDLIDSIQSGVSRNDVSNSLISCNYEKHKNDIRSIFSFDKGHNEKRDK